MNTLAIKGYTIGKGRPKVIIPIVGTTEEEIKNAAESFTNLSYDCVEWRADWFQGIEDQKRVFTCLSELRKRLPNKMLLFTIRTKKEGGELEVTPEHYRDLIQMASEMKIADIYDVEIFTGDEIVTEIIDMIHNNGGYVIASNHDFRKTPDKEDIIGRLRKMQMMGADILKIAVMPTSKKDVLTLLSATEEMYTLYAEKPLVTMSMGGKGVISRLSGEAFGSSMTFGAAGKASAPGQMNVNDLNTVLNLLHESM